MSMVGSPVQRLSLLEDPISISDTTTVRVNGPLIMTIST